MHSRARETLPRVVVLTLVASAGRACLAFTDGEFDDLRPLEKADTGADRSASLGGAAGFGGTCAGDACSSQGSGGIIRGDAEAGTDTEGADADAGDGKSEGGCNSGEGGKAGSGGRPGYVVHSQLVTAPLGDPV